ncbi:hypothetical protein GGS21DRAFT_491881 [Xylaria nigripes]|nr:hypothetical protein GGS21DRAFT_491881 [Xylaria nigripes]
MSEQTHDQSHNPSTIYRTLCFYSPPPDNLEPEYIEGDTTTAGKRNYPHHKPRDLQPQHRLCRPHCHKHPPPTLGNSAPQPRRPGPPGAQSATVFDTTLRKASASKTPNRQVHKAHMDQSPKGAFLRAKQHLASAEQAAIEAGKANFPHRERVIARAPRRGRLSALHGGARVAEEG